MFPERVCIIPERYPIFALLEIRDPESVSTCVSIKLTWLVRTFTIPERLLTAPDRFVRVLFVILSPHERKLIATLFCSTLPERLLNPLERAVRLPERFVTAVERVARFHESELIFVV